MLQSSSLHTRLSSLFSRARHRTSVSPLSTSMNDPGTADATAKAVAAQQAMQSVSDKRNELESSLSSLLEHSVLQVMSSQQGSDCLPGHLVPGNSLVSFDVEKQKRVATGHCVIAALNDENAIQIFSSLGLQGTLIESSFKSIKRNIPQHHAVVQLPAQIQQDDIQAFLSRVDEDGWCTVKSVSLAMFGSEAFSGALCYYLI